MLDCEKCKIKDKELEQAKDSIRYLKQYSNERDVQLTAQATLISSLQGALDEIKMLSCAAGDCHVDGSHCAATRIAAAAVKEAR
jgi:hypothetical protein